MLIIVPAVPLRVLQVIVEPSEQDLLWRKSQELLQSFTILKQSIELGMQLNIDLAE